ncbi:hypothetical protein MLD38_011605 [Melastoma candidum]|uniref:Uncharacterized protein n=1 Tax=Melastoma candidum TaxID=119954 RepID=A0ACB9R3L0_9MYRT|nr:hypothetical protein MLD38_011605 [Melastoma candidum]
MSGSLCLVRILSLYPLTRHCPDWNAVPVYAIGRKITLPARDCLADPLAVYGLAVPTPSVFITFVAWCCSDLDIIFDFATLTDGMQFQVIRYAHYTLNCLKSCPPSVTYISVVNVPSFSMHKKKTNLYRDLFSSLPFDYNEFISEPVGQPLLLSFLGYLKRS